MSFNKHKKIFTIVLVVKSIHISKDSLKSMEITNQIS